MCHSDIPYRSCYTAMLQRSGAIVAGATIRVAMTESYPQWHRLLVSLGLTLSDTLVLYMTGRIDCWYD